VSNNKTRLEKFQTLIPLYCEKTGEEFVEGEWEAGQGDIHKVDGILVKNKIRQEQAVDVYINQMGFPMIPAGLGIPQPTQPTPEMDGASLRKSIRFLDALNKVAKRPGNFKAKAALERIGERFYGKISETLFKEFDPVEIVNMRKDGKL
jgi:hypothetical protein